MGKFSHPRRGSRQFNPRARADSEIPRIRNWVAPEGKSILGFSGYKVGITHAHLIENNPKSILVNQSRQVTATVLHTPPLKAIGTCFYRGKRKVGQLTAENLPKDLSRTIRPLPKGKAGLASPEKFDKVVLLVCTQPRLASFGKKKPEVMEIAISGSPEEQRKKAEELLGKDIRVSDVLSVGDFLDVFAVTKGRGFLGPVARHNVPLQSPKTKRSRRRPGNIGSWRPKRVLWQTPMPGKTGYNQRCEYNKQVVLISDKGIDVPGGIGGYGGKVEGDFVLIAGSVPGPSKRLVRVRFASKIPTKLNPPRKVESVAMEGVLKQ
jgi:large subunit ribosomal protein L3